MFIAAMSFAGCDTLKCVSMSDQECNLSPAIININSNDILTKTWTEPKWAETSQNNPKPAETTQKKLENDPKPPKFQNWGNLEYSNRFRAQIPKFGYFGPRSINFLILPVPEHCLYPSLEMLDSNLTLFFKSFKPKYQNLRILGQKVLTL